MAKKNKQCSNCEFWEGKDPDMNLCSEIKVGRDVFIGGLYLKTASTFGCVKYKEKEVSDDSDIDRISTDSVSD